MLVAFRALYHKRQRWARNQQKLYYFNISLRFVVYNRLSYLNLELNMLNETPSEVSSKNMKSEIETQTSPNEVFPILTLPISRK